jgi:hypothetical protein
MEAKFKISVNQLTNKIYVGKIHNYVHYINTTTCFGSEGPIFKQTRNLDREAYVTKHMKLNYANML